MPYARKGFRRSRKGYRRTRKGRTRGRFSRKRFQKGVPRGLKAGLYIPRQAFVKLPITRIITSPALLANQNYNLGIWGTGLTAPFSTGVVPAAGDLYPLGLSQYSNFYQFYKVLGASIKVQINSSTTISGDSTATTQASYFCSLSAAQGDPYDTDIGSNYFKMSNITTQDLISYPGTSWRLASQSMGNRQNVFLKAFRKTKSMLGIKDMRDAVMCQGFLPGTEASYPNGRNPTASDSYDNNWFYIIRVDPNISNPIPAGSFQMIVKVKYYVQLYGRDFNNQASVPS